MQKSIQIVKNAKIGIYTVRVPPPALNKPNKHGHSSKAFHISFHTFMKWHVCSIYRKHKIHFIFVSYKKEVGSDFLLFSLFISAYSQNVYLLYRCNV